MNSTPPTPIKCHRCQKSIHPSRITYAYNPATGMHDVRVDGFLDTIKGRVGKFTKNVKDRLKERGMKTKFIKEMTKILRPYMKPVSSRYVPSEQLQAENLENALVVLLQTYVEDMESKDEVLMDLREIFANIRKLGTEKGGVDLTIVIAKCNDYINSFRNTFYPEFKGKLDLNDFHL